jgi:protein-S-isoprenylcysteine O-methyltransferase Ste14
MESYNKIVESVLNKKIFQRSKVHQVLAYSYSVQFVLFLIGVYLDLIFKFKIFASPIMAPVGVIFLMLASFLILWAQKASRDLNIENLTKESFCQGPYRYTRSPTHWGLFLLMLGFGMITNALFVILFTFVAFIVSRFIFLEKQEDMLAEKYGAPYLEYQKMVRF